MAKIKEIHWIEDQPCIRTARLKIEKSGLIQDLVCLVEMYNLKGIHGNKTVEDYGERGLYTISVGNEAQNGKYYVSIKRTHLSVTDAFGEIFLE